MTTLRRTLYGLAALACLLGAFVFLVFTDRGFAHGADKPIVFPAPSGRYSVGRRLMDWTDLKRAEPFDHSRRRELMVWIWYPAAPGSRAPAVAKYLPGPWGHSAARWEALDMRLRSGSIWTALLHSPVSAGSVERSTIHAIDGAPIAEPGEGARFPVLLFSPGLGKMPTDYTAVIEDVASHGYVVVGVNPTYFVPVTQFRDGRFVGAMPPWERIGGKLEKQFPIWVDDLRFVADRMAARSGGDFSGKLDVSQFGAFGHSYGGAAALAVAGVDSRIVAAVDWDGSPRGDRSRWSTPKPAMLLQSDHGAIDGDRSSLRFYDQLEHGYRITIGEALHRGFSDEIAFPLPSKMREELVGRIDAARMVRITGTYTRAFFDTYLQHKPAQMLCGQESDFPELTVRRKGADSFCR